MTIRSRETYMHCYSSIILAESRNRNTCIVSQKDVTTDMTVQTHHLHHTTCTCTGIPMQLGHAKSWQNSVAWLSKANLCDDNDRV